MLYICAMDRSLRWFNKFKKNPDYTARVNHIVHFECREYTKAIAKETTMPGLKITTSSRTLKITHFTFQERNRILTFDFSKIPLYCLHEIPSWPNVCRSPKRPHMTLPSWENHECIFPFPDLTIGSYKALPKKICLKLSWKFGSRVIRKASS